jgi:hypothetical protein
VPEQEVVQRRVKLSEAPFGRYLGARLDDAAVERHQAAAASLHNAIAGARQAGVDPEHDHAG